MGLGLSLRPALEQRFEQTQLLYESVGDIELYSLHRIKNQVRTLDVHSATSKHLMNRLFQENAEYRKEQGHKRYCVTGEHIERAVSDTIDFLETESNRGLTAIIDETVKTKVEGFFKEKLQLQETKIKEWFADNFDKLYYDMDSKLPWAVVQKLRRNLQTWAAGNAGIWYQEIGDFAAEIAKENQIDPERYDTTEELWNALKEIN